MILNVHVESELSNATVNPPLVAVDFTIMVSCLVAVSSVAIILNVIALTIFAKLDALHIGDIYCVSLGVLDCLESVAWIVSQCLSLKPGNFILYAIFASALNWFIFTSWILNMLLAINRFYAINYPMKFRYFTPFRAKLEIFAGLIAGFICILIEVILDIARSHGVFYFTVIGLPLLFLLCVLIMAFATYRNISKLKYLKQQLEFELQSRHSSSQDHGIHNKSAINLENMFICIVVTFLVLNLPTLFLETVYAVTATEGIIYPPVVVAFQWSFLLQALANAVDPMYYFVFRPEFGKRLRSFFNCCGSGRANNGHKSVE